MRAPILLPRRQLLQKYGTFATMKVTMFDKSMFLQQSVPRKFVKQRERTI